MLLLLCSRMNEKKLIPVIEHHMEDAKNQKLEYVKLFLVFVAITLVSIFVSIVNNSSYVEDLNDVELFISMFMGVFFVTFALFKIINLPNFVSGFMMYDIIAKKSRAYAKAYPVIQLFLGCAMFIFATNPIVHFLAALVSFIALVGVYIKIQAKEKIHCACLGNVIKMPLTTVSAFEDGIMFVLAAYMFLAMI